MSRTMERAIHRHQARSRLVVTSLALLASLPFAERVHAECISPMITPTECDFKNEDTHLWGYQPGMYFAKEDRVDELIKQGETFIENYYSSVKVTGDFAIRAMIAPTAVSMTTVEAVEAANTAIMLANDPLSLKAIYTDVYCEIYFAAVGAVSGVDRSCPTTPELLTDIQKLAELDRVRQEITDIVLNPNLVLGEQWTDAINEIEAIRGKLTSIDTFGRNILTTEIDAKYTELYPSLAALLGRPNETTAQFDARVARHADSRRNTIRDHLMATNKDRNNLVEFDNPELERLHDMSGRAVGRMQAFEIENMIGMQDVQSWQMVSEEMMNQGAMFIQDYADKHDQATRRRAFAIKSAEPIPFHEAVVGGGEAFRQ